jgi:hypothetical protein
VDKSVEKRGSFSLSARSVSGRLQNGEKVSEIEMIQINSKRYIALYIVIGDAVPKYCGTSHERCA